MDELPSLTPGAARTRPQSAAAAPLDPPPPRRACFASRCRENVLLGASQVRRGPAIWTPSSPHLLPTRRPVLEPSSAGVQRCRGAGVQLGRLPTVRRSHRPLLPGEMGHLLEKPSADNALRKRSGKRGREWPFTQEMQKRDRPRACGRF